MPIDISSVKFAYTTGNLGQPGGGEDFTAVALRSLGGAKTSPSFYIPLTSLNNVVDDIAPSERDAGRTEYRAVDIVNTDTVETAYLCVLEVTAQPGNGDQWSLGRDGGTNTNGDVVIAAETTAPSGISFSSKLNLPNLGPGTTSTTPGDTPSTGRIRVWLKRVTPAGATQGDDIFPTIQFRFSADST